jgi:glycosyltransferase involved in cell wall biosynthesis
MIKLSVVIPAYNEEKYIAEVIQQLEALDTSELGFSKEIIVVDDGSTDNTALEVKKFNVRYLRQQNAGKGSAVQAGINAATGQYVLIQDSDLEYSISDILLMLKALTTAETNERVAIYGSRVLQQKDNGGLQRFALKPLPGQSFGPWLANAILSTLVLVLYQVWISDTLTGYKLYPREFFSRTSIQSKGFEADHEITAKLLRQGFRIIETPAEYNPRSRAEGKKISSTDGFKALAAFIKYRFI